MSKLWDTPKNNIYNDLEETSPFDDENLKFANKVKIVSAPPLLKKRSTVKSQAVVASEMMTNSIDELDRTVIKADLDFLDLVDELPGVADVMPGDMEPTKALRALTLRGANEDVKEFTNEIKARRLLEEESRPVVAQVFYYDVEKVRIFGQYGASTPEMAAYFEVDSATINKLLSDEQSDFYKVYNKARALLGLSLRQVQIKSALAGSEKMMIHLGKHVLDQRDTVTEAPRETDLARDGKKRKSRIITLTKQIQEFDE